MCGIYGVLGRSADPKNALAAMRHRGPDGLHSWQDEAASIWLGHARLAIIDPTAAGDQPMSSPDGRFVMVYNGEIYNFLELRAELEDKGEMFVSHCDSEVLLRLFAREGRSCFSRLQGMFAAAFWDRAALSLTLVRDSMGVKPLYWTGDQHRFAFASELKSLVRGGEVVPKVNPRAVLRHLGLLWSPGEETIVEGVHKLLPGEYMEVRHKVEAPVIGRYADPAHPVIRKSRANVSDLILQTRAMVEQAVQRQMIADVPLGAFLSGGLDSSAVVAFAARHHTGPGKLRCFSIEVKADELGSEGFAEDLPYARKVANALDVDLDVVSADERMMDRLPTMIYQLDEPTPDPSALNTLLISELARANGIKVLLSGTGGDDIFTGYRRHYALIQERKWAWLPQAVRHKLATTTKFLPQGPPSLRRIAKAFRYADQPESDRLLTYFQWLETDRLMNLLSRDLRAQVAADDLFTPMHKTLARLPEETSALDRMLFLECNHFLADHNLNYADKMAMACGVETRVPLLDEDLVQFAGTIPQNLKQRGRTGKWIFKKAMEDILPVDVIYRPKTGFGVPLRQWLNGPMRQLVEHSLSREKMMARGLFDPDAVEGLLRGLFAGTNDAGYTVFALMCIEMWCEQFIDGDFPSDKPNFYS